MHTCPECGSACTCGGDIEDHNTGDGEFAQGCTCCAELPVDDDDVYWVPDELED
jgi:hypothetical protein